MTVEYWVWKFIVPVSRNSLPELCVESITIDEIWEVDTANMIAGGEVYIAIFNSNEQFCRTYIIKRKGSGKIVWNSAAAQRFIALTLLWYVVCFDVDYEAKSFKPTVIFWSYRIKEIGK